MISKLALAKRIGPPVLAALLGATLAWQWQANSWGNRLADTERRHAEQMTAITRAAADAHATIRAREKALAERIAELDTRHYEEFRDVQKTNDQLAADLAAARQRLSVRVSHSCSDRLPDAEATTGMDDGAGTRADLHPDDAAGIIRVTARADECRARLTGLQEWATAVSAGGE